MNGAVGGGWLGARLAATPGKWRIALPAEAGQELITRAGEFRAGEADYDPSAPAPPVSATTRELVAEVTRRLTSGPGFVLLTGFPVTGPASVVEAAYWLFGQLIGPAVSQTRDRALIGRVEDAGADLSQPVQRGHRSAGELPFHADRADVIGLLCVRPAAEGGLSRLVSSKLLHDTILAESPELLPVLYRPFPQDQRGEEQPGRPPWCGLPVFSRVDGDFAARYVRRFIEGSQRHAGAPRLTAPQLAAMDAIDAILARPGVALEMDLRPGDLQLINNFHLLHARTSFRDPAGPGAGRLLLRLWLSMAGSPALPAEYRDLYGDTTAGGYRGGVWPPGELLRAPTGGAS